MSEYTIKSDDISCLFLFAVKIAHVKANKILGPTTFFCVKCYEYFPGLCVK